MASDHLRGDALVTSVIRALSTGGHGLQQRGPLPPVLEIIRRSTLIKRSLPGLSFKAHVKHVCSFLGCGQTAASRLATDADILQNLLPGAPRSLCVQTLRRCQTLEDAIDVILAGEYHTSSKASYSAADASVKEWYLCYLANAYPLKPLDRIRVVLKTSSWNLRTCCQVLDNTPDMLVGPRKCIALPCDEMPSPHFDACLELASRIGAARKEKIARAREIARALRDGHVGTCLVCFDTFAVPQLVTCEGLAEKPHSICDACFVQYVSTQVFDEGIASKKCVCCASTYSERALLELLPARTLAVFTRLEARSALAAASLRAKSEGLTDETHACRCGNVVYVPAGTSVHECFVCMASTCVLCDMPAHVPLRCDEVEKDAEAKLRVKIEEAMTAALVRTCVCGQVFLKESGCNKMTCKACGALMCYLCKSRIAGYDHFRTTKCTLYGEYTEIDNVRIREAAQAAQAEQGSEACSDTEVL